jgi:hypothetical protein
VDDAFGFVCREGGWVGIKCNETDGRFRVFAECGWLLGSSLTMVYESLATFDDPLIRETACKSYDEGKPKSDVLYVVYSI